MEPNDPNQPSQPLVKLANSDEQAPHNTSLPYFLQPDPNAPAPLPPGQKPKRKWGFLIVAGIILVVLVALAVLVAVKSVKKTTTTTASSASAISLTTKQIDGVQFAYPAAWQRVDASSLGFTLAYGSAATYTDSNVSVFYKKTQLFPTAEKVAAVSATDKTALGTAIIATIQSKNTAATADCVGYKLLSQTQLNNTTYFGVDAYWSCSSTAVRELDRYLYTGDGNLYQVSIHGVDAAWQGASLNTLQSMHKQILPLQ